MNIRERLFFKWTGCSNHDCIVTGPKINMGTNTQCKCIVNASRAQLTILQSRIETLIKHAESNSSQINQSR
jgi:hypothetical protein